MKRLFSRALGALALVGAALPAWPPPLAQEVTPRPAPARPDPSETSTIRQRLPDSDEFLRPRTPARTPPATELPADPAPAPAVPDGPTVVLAAVEIAGATAFPLAELNALYADDLARPVSLADIESLAGRIGAYYRRNGLLLTRVVVRPQALDAGILRLQVVEGAIREVRFEGDGAADLELAAYTRRIRAERPLSLATLERQLLLIEDLDGLSVTDSRVRALDEDAGDYELVVTLEVDRIDLLTYVDNRGTHSVGPLELWTAVGANSPLGGGERLQAGAFVVPNQPSELRYYELSYLQPIGSQGTKATLLLSSSDSKPDPAYTGADEEIDGKGLTLRLSHPLIRRREETLRAQVTFDYQDTREEDFGVAVIDDRLRVLRLRADYAADSFLEGTHFAGLELSQGLDILGASEPGAATLSRSDGRSDFTKLEGYVSRAQSFGDYVGAQLSAAGQLAFDPLLSGEEFGLGGGQYGRAYNYYEVSGDDGFALAAEVRYGRLFDEPAWLDSYQFYGFYDWGVVWNDNAEGELARQSLSSLGAGIRLGLLDSLSLDLQLARPLTREPFETGSNATRFFFSLTGRF